MLRSRVLARYTPYIWQSTSSEEHSRENSGASCRNVCPDGSSSRRSIQGGGRNTCSAVVHVDFDVAVVCVLGKDARHHCQNTACTRRQFEGKLNAGGQEEGFAAVDPTQCATVSPHGMPPSESLGSLAFDCCGTHLIVSGAVGCLLHRWAGLTYRLRPLRAKKPYCGDSEQGSTPLGVLN